MDNSSVVATAGGDVDATGGSDGFTFRVPENSKARRPYADQYSITECTYDSFDLFIQGF
jgi:hypothetical protein